VTRSSILLGAILCTFIIISHAAKDPEEENGLAWDGMGSVSVSVSVSVAHIKNNRRADGVFRTVLKGRGNCILPFTSNDIYDSFPSRKKRKIQQGKMKQRNEKTVTMITH